MIELTLKQQEIIDNHKSEIEKIAKGLWNVVNEVDFDPMHPQWESFDDPIKDKYISAACYILLVNQGED